MRNIHNFWHKLHMTRIGKLAVRIAQCRAVGEQNRDLQHLIFTIFAKTTPLFEARETISQRIWSALLVQRFNQLIVLILWCADAWNGRYRCIRGYQQLFYAPILARIATKTSIFVLSKVVRARYTIGDVRSGIPVALLWCWCTHNALGPAIMRPGWGGGSCLTENLGCCPGALDDSDFLRQNQRTRMLRVQHTSRGTIISNSGPI